MDFSQITDQLRNLTWQQFAVLAVVVAVVDWVVAVLAAVSPPVNYFSFQAAARVLETHVLKRVIPIAGLAFIAQSIPAGPARDLVWLTATGALGLYVAETIKSLMSSAKIAKEISDEVTSAPIAVTPVVVETPAGPVTAAVVETPTETAIVPDPSAILADQAIPDDIPEGPLP